MIDFWYFRLGRTYETVPQLYAEWCMKWGVDCPLKRPTVAELLIALEGMK